MDTRLIRRWTPLVLWCGWFLALLMLACAYQWPVGVPRPVISPHEVYPLLGSLMTPDGQAEALFPWLPRRGWRKWAWRHYQAARRAYARARWAARVVYLRAVWAAGIAQLILSGVLTLAALVDWVTRAQLRRQLGALPVLYAVLEVLQVREVINRHCPTAAEVDHGAVAVVLILNRLMAPRPLVKVADWVAQTVLTQTLGLPASKFNDDRLGRTLDALAQHQREIWLDIVQAALVQFDIDLRFIFFDLTAFVMQGEYSKSDKVDFGFAHNTPSDKRKVKEALAAASDGHIPLDYEVLSGRTADLATVQANMERLGRLLQRRGYPLDQVVIIGDRGTLNDAIAVAYDDKGLKYLAGLKAHKKEHAELLRAVPEVQFRAHPLTERRGRDGHYGLPCQVTFEHDGRTVSHRGLVLLSGPMRHAVRQARAVQLRALRQALSGVRAKSGTKRYRSVREVQARAETCLRRSPVGDLMRVAAYRRDEGQVDLRWWIDTDALWHAMQTDGRYLLVTNDWTLAPQRMFELYRAKDGVEKCFRLSKHDLKVRPIYVHSDERLEALLLVNMLAVLVYHLLERDMRRRGLSLTVRRLIEQLEDLAVIATHCRDGSVAVRLTPANEEQERLLVFLSALIAELRRQRVALSLSGGLAGVALPAAPPSPPGLPTPVGMA